MGPIDGLVTLSVDRTKSENASDNHLLSAMNKAWGKWFRYLQDCAGLWVDKFSYVKYSTFYTLLQEWNIADLPLSGIGV